jgi:hypothetical protein
MKSESRLERAVSDLLKPSPASSYATKAASSEARVTNVDHDKLTAALHFSDVGEEVAYGITSSIGAGVQLLTFRQDGRAFKAEPLQAWSGPPLPDDGSVVVMVRVQNLTDLNALASGRVRASLDISKAASAAA